MVSLSVSHSDALCFSTRTSLFVQSFHPTLTRTQVFLSGLLTTIPSPHTHLHDHATLVEMIIGVG
jgi:hypothetical protein